MLVESRLMGEISESKDEPDWMIEKRLNAWRIFEETPLPSGGEEAWRRTDVSQFELREEEPLYGSGGELSASEAEKVMTISANNVSSSCAGRMVQKDSESRVLEFDAEYEKKGVIFTNLKSATRKCPELVQEYFMTRCVRPEMSRFDALHGALWTDGAFIYVPEGREVVLPLHALFYLDLEKAALFPHLLIVLERGSSATVYAEWRSAESQSRSLCFPAVEVVVGEEATLNYFGLKDLGSGTASLSTRRVIAEKDSKVLWVEGMLGGGMSKENMEIMLSGPGAELNMVGAFFAQGNQHLDMSPNVHHIAPHTKGDVLINGVLKDNSRTIFNGMVRIEKSALYTEAQLINHNLLLSPGARADTIPRLEIECDEVKASHGVTAGEMDRDMLFYCMSRGLDERAAQSMIVDGFYESLLQQIPQVEIRKMLGSAIREKTEI